VQVDALLSDAPERPSLLTAVELQDPAAPTKAHLRLEDARKLTRDNPAAVANIVKAWIGSEVPA
jgi:flagellar M-ring protein FliF